MMQARPRSPAGALSAHRSSQRLLLSASTGATSDLPCSNPLFLFTCRRTIFDTLYTLLAFGHARAEDASYLDPPSSYFRVRLVAVLLEACGGYFRYPATSVLLKSPCNLFAWQRDIAGWRPTTSCIVFTCWVLSDAPEDASDASLRQPLRLDICELLSLSFMRTARAAPGASWTASWPSSSATCSPSRSCRSTSSSTCRLGSFSYMF